MSRNLYLLGCFARYGAFHATNGTSCLFVPEAEFERVYTIFDKTFPLVDHGKIFVVVHDWWPGVIKINFPYDFRQPVDHRFFVEHVVFPDLTKSWQDREKEEKQTQARVEIEELLSDSEDEYVTPINGTPTAEHGCTNSPFVNTTAHDDALKCISEKLINHIFIESGSAINASSSFLNGFFGNEQSALVSSPHIYNVLKNRFECSIELVHSKVKCRQFRACGTTTLNIADIYKVTMLQLPSK